MKICLVCASGGHLIEMMRLNDAFTSHEVFLVTYKEKFLNVPKHIKRVYLIKNIIVNRVQSHWLTKRILILIQMLILTREAIKILLVEKPDIIISTGSEIAIPFCYIAKIFRKKIIFIESLCRLHDLSGTGKIIVPISDLFLVQWDSLVKKYKRVQYKGNILSWNKNIYQSNTFKENNYIFVTVGTAPFPRLIKSMDQIAKILEDKVIMQIGKTSYQPKNTEYFDFKDYDKIRQLNKDAKMIITHAGVGSILTALDYGKPLIIVPRLKKYREINDDHQLEIAHLLKKQNLAEVAYEPKDILQLLQLPLQEFFSKTQLLSDCQNDLIGFLQNFLNEDIQKKNGSSQQCLG
jgi:UDP-N-acetylglucosamine transferase subunit ALG13